ncbi:MAG: YraN family protein [Flavobacteriales bacterium]|nr:YraN family protein [Flavobacteriales bacterium]
MAGHNELGETGENLAAAFLKKKGYTILDQNWRSGRNEIDLVARIGDMIVFVEVKTRSTDFFGEPSETVSRKQQNRIIKAANDYLEKKQLLFEARFDIISIVKNRAGERIDHIEDAFFPLA